MKQNHPTYSLANLIVFQINLLSFGASLKGLLKKTFYLFFGVLKTKSVLFLRPWQFLNVYFIIGALKLNVHVLLRLENRIIISSVLWCGFSETNRISKTGREPQAAVLDPPGQHIYLRFRKAGRGLRAKIYELRVMSSGQWVTSYKLQVTSYEKQAMS